METGSLMFGLPKPGHRCLFFKSGSASESESNAFHSFLGRMYAGAGRENVCLLAGNDIPGLLFHLRGEIVNLAVKMWPK
jgi:hypothetical protein